MVSSYASADGSRWRYWDAGDQEAYIAVSVEKAGQGRGTTQAPILDRLQAAKAPW